MLPARGSQRAVRSLDTGTIDHDARQAEHLLRAPCIQHLLHLRRHGERRAEKRSGEHVAARHAAPVPWREEARVTEVLAGEEWRAEGARSKL